MHPPGGFSLLRPSVPAYRERERMERKRDRGTPKKSPCTRGLHHFYGKRAIHLHFELYHGRVEPRLGKNPGEAEAERALEVNEITKKKKKNGKKKETENPTVNLAFRMKT